MNKKAVFKELLDKFETTDYSYVMWFKENSYQREVVDMIKKIEAAREDAI